MNSNNILLLILFNIIILILSYKSKRYIYISYPFIFIFFTVILIKLIYKRYSEYLEGYTNYSIYSYWNEEKDSVNDEFDEDLFKKVDKMIELLIEKETSYNDKIYGDKQCEGEFVLVNEGKECGIGEYDEYKYKITQPGNNCEYLPGRIKYVKKPRCGLDEKCNSDSDCKIGNICIDNKCKKDLGCNSTKLDNCNTEDKCKILNKKIGENKYIFSKGKCMKNICTKKTFYNCNDKEQCEGLGYDFKWEEKKEIKCQKLSRQVEKCSQYECPDGYSVSNENKDYKCKNEVPPSEVGDYSPGLLSKKSYDDDLSENSILNECSTSVCCEPNYKCGEYYLPKDSNVNLDECKDCDVKKCKNECYSKSLSSDKDPYKLFKKGKKFKDVYYPYKSKEIEGKEYYPNNTCNSVTECNESECTVINKCTCDNGVGAEGSDCPVNNGKACKSCNSDYYLYDKECFEKQPCFLIDGCSKLYDTPLYGLYENNGSIFADSPKNKILNPVGIGMAWYYTEKNGSFSKCTDALGDDGDSENAKPQLKDFEFCLPPKSINYYKEKNDEKILTYKDDKGKGLKLNAWNGIDYTIKECEEGKLCDNCKDGYSKEDNSKVCSPCKKGYYKGTDDEQCMPCKNGFSTLDNGSVSKDNCLPSCKTGKSEKYGDAPPRGRDSGGIGNSQNLLCRDKIGVRKDDCRNYYQDNNGIGRLCESRKDWYSNLMSIGCDPGQQCIP